MADNRIFTKPLLAVVKSALVELESHSTMTILFEKYDFEPGNGADFSNKINRAGSFLDHYDWNDSTNTSRLLELLEEFYLQYQHLLEHDDTISNNAIHAIRKLDKSLKGKGVVWNGGSFEVLSSSHLKSVKELEELDLSHIHVEIERARKNTISDPSDSVTSAENILVATCKGILKEEDIKWSKTASPMQLFNSVLETLEILPENISEESRGKDAAKKTLRSMGAAIQGLSELRNLYGDSHGKEPGFKGIETRHARLMVGLSESISVFLIETHRKKKT